MGVRGKQRGLLTPCLVGSLTQIRLSYLHRHLLLPAQDSTFVWHVPTNRVPDLCDASNCLSLIFFSAAAVGGAGSLDVAVTLRPLALRVAGVHVHVHVPLIQVFVVETCRHSLCRKFPPSVRFRRLFLSQLIKQQEEAGADPLDELYDALAEVLGPEDANECYKNYLLPHGGAVTLLENTALISQGTTGLVTWEAGLYLAEWALDHREVFTGRTVLELGSGMGVTGITVCRCCSPSSLVFSDYNPSVLQKLRTNVGVNGLSNATPVVSVEQLDWTSATEEQLQKIGADVVIAADVTYDPEVARNLVTLVSKVIRSSGPEVFICSTIRNLETHHGFKQHLGKKPVQLAKINKTNNKMNFIKMNSPIYPCARGFAKSNHNSSIS
uniref:Eukaryotic elongation factor 2 lysine methyltransferase n=1 Tax=Cynoglossus semilaevis TaxID=244447 RepID=A0A3P8VN41_CYNSE